MKVVTKIILTIKKIVMIKHILHNINYITFAGEETDKVAADA